MERKARYSLSARKINEICVAIAGELSDQLDAGEVSHQEIRNRLIEFASMADPGCTDESLVKQVVNYLLLAP